MDHALGKRAWQWLFLLEGIPALAVGLAIWAMLPPFPDQIKKHWALNHDEIDLAVARSKGMFHNQLLGIIITKSS
jgi:hypothetical protein